MKKVYWHHDRFMIYRIKQLLDDHSIPNFIKNEFAIGAMGELSPMDISPEVWLTDEEWLPKANSLIEQFSHTQETLQGVSWVCEQCDEVNEPNFLLCWQCNTPKTTQ